MKRCRDRGEAGPPFRILQPEKGYRFSIDSVLLADFAASYCGESVLDLGTGSGVVLILLARRCTSLKRGTGVEIQKPLWEFACRNIEENGFSDRLRAVLGDLREPIPALPPRSFDLVVSNPPYRKIGEGRRNPDPRKEIARHEVSCTLSDLFSAAGRYLSRRGRFAFVCPAARVPDVFLLGERTGIAPNVVRFIHPHADEPANRILVVGSREGSADPVVLPPLVVYRARRTYHPEVERIFAGFFRS